MKKYGTVKSINKVKNTLSKIIRGWITLSDTSLIMLTPPKGGQRNELEAA